MPDLVATRFGPLDRELSHVALHAIAIVACDGVKALDRAVETLHGDKDSPTYQEPPSARWNEMLTGFLPGVYLVIDITRPSPDGFARYTGALSREDERVLRSFFAAAANFLLSEAMAIDEVLELHVSWDPERADAAQPVDDLIHTAVTTSRALLNHADTGTWRTLVCKELQPAETAVDGLNPGALTVAAWRRYRINHPKNLVISFAKPRESQYSRAALLEMVQIALQQARREAPGLGWRVHLDSAVLRDADLIDLRPRFDYITDIRRIRVGNSSALGSPDAFHDLLDEVALTAGRPDMIFCQAPIWDPGKRAISWPADLLTGIKVAISCPSAQRPSLGKLLSEAGARRITFIDDVNPTDIEHLPQWPPSGSPTRPEQQLVHVASATPATFPRDRLLLKAAIAATVALIIGTIAYLLAGTQQSIATILQMSATSGGIAVTAYTLATVTKIRKFEINRAGEARGSTDRAATSLYEVTPAVLTTGPGASTDGYFARVVPDEECRPLDPDGEADSPLCSTPMTGSVATASPPKKIWQLRH